MTTDILKLPLFASDSAIADAIVGRAASVGFRAILPLLERDGFPRPDPLIGLRYVPAVKAFFDRRAGIAPAVNLDYSVPVAPTEVVSCAKISSRRRRRAER